MKWQVGVAIRSVSQRTIVLSTVHFYRAQHWAQCDHARRDRGGGEHTTSLHTSDCQAQGATRLLPASNTDPTKSKNKTHTMLSVETMLLSLHECHNRIDDKLLRFRFRVTVAARTQSESATLVSHTQRCRIHRIYNNPIGPTCR